MGGAWCAAPGLAVLLTVAASAVEVERLAIPTALDHGFLRQRLVEQAFPGPGEASPKLRDVTGCNHVVLARPAVAGSEGRLEVTARFSASLGAAVGGGRCLGRLRRDGSVRAALEPFLEAGARRVGFRVVDSSIAGPDGARTLDSALWDLVRARVHQSLGAFQLDLERPLAEIGGLLPLLLPGRDPELTARLAASLAIDGVEVSPEALVLLVGMDRPGPAAPPAGDGAPEAPWTPERVARWEAGLQGWDAFLTSVVKQGGRDAGTEDRRELLAILLDARHEVTALLATPPSDAPDPVPALFLDTWDRLAPVLRRLSSRMPAESALAYASFIASADALAVLEELGPVSGVELSVDGLRRLARMIEPAAADPVAYHVGLDPELRALFGFGPEPSRRETGKGREETPEAPPAPAASAPLPGRSRWIQLASVGVLRPLDDWIPSHEELPIYLPLVRDLLVETAQDTAVEKQLPERYAGMFRTLTLATAWQESCWRQYTLRGGGPVPLTSRTGAVGIMQVSPHVWRGFYDATALRANLGYNAAAGSEILHHYLVDYALARGEHEVRGQPDDLARATYAAYNAGPRQLSRYRRSFGQRVGHRIDAAFFEKFEAVRSGHELAVVSCYPGLSLDDVAEARPDLRRLPTRPGPGLG